MAIKKTALLLDDELVAQVKALLGTTTTTETIAEAMREVIRVEGRARHFERMRRRELARVIATHLADASAWAQLHRNDVAARLVPLLVGGGAATCGVIDLEVLATFEDPPSGPRPPPNGRCSRGCPWTTPSSTGPCRSRAC